MGEGAFMRTVGLALKPERSSRLLLFESDAEDEEEPELELAKEEKLTSPFFAAELVGEVRDLGRPKLEELRSCSRALCA